MPPRLAHSKSRNGCQRCKARKVKCSESKPKCASCQRHGLDCVYSPVVAPKRSYSSLQAPSTAASSSSNSKQPRLSTSTSPVVSQAHAYPSPDSTANSSTLGGHISSPLLPAAAVSAVPSLFKDSSGEGPARRLLELRLLSHFLTVVVRTFAGDDQPEVLNAWRHRLPALALRFPFLLNSVLATSALHLAVGGHGLGDSISTESAITPSTESRLANSGDFDHIIGPMSRGDFAAVHQTYFDLALSQHRAAIDVLCTENADAVCVTSVLISNHNFLLGSRQGYRTADELLKQEADPALALEQYEIPLHWLQMSAGIREVVRYAQEKLLGADAIIKVMMSTFHMQALIEILRGDRVKGVFPGLLNFQTNPEPSDVEPRMGDSWTEGEFEISVPAVYDRALRYLGHIFLMIEAGESKARLARLCMSFTSMIPRAFIKFVEQGRPRALVILAHLFAMTIVLEDVWWFKGAAERHIRGLGPLVGAEWQWAMEWPRKAARRDVWGRDYPARTIAQSA